LETMSSTGQAKAKKQVVRKQRSGYRQKWDTFTDWARAKGAIVLGPLARFIARLGIHPNTITIAGLILQIGVAVVFGLGYLTLGGWLLLALSPVDALDGLLARTVGKQSRFGAFLDSTVDRLSDTSLILGLTAFYIQQGAYLNVALLLISLVASMMISYIRARAESLNFSCKVGLLTRVERLLVIGGLSAVGLHPLLPPVLAVFTVFTVIQRMWHVYQASRQDEEQSQ
jgi:CDP-diacylglycerol--glycerol-3-phosphate 3-phosphatidyltransferase